MALYARAIEKIKSTFKDSNETNKVSLISASDEAKDVPKIDVDS